MDSSKKKLSILEMALIGMFAAIMAICAWISIPATIPFTLQTMGVFLAVGILGGRNGTISVLIYLIIGAIGAPVFAGFTGGIGRLLDTTGGYIIGFLFSALVMWLFEKLLGKKHWVLILSMIVGLIVCYALGTAWFMIVYTAKTGAIGLWTALSWCVIPYILPDLTKITVAFAITVGFRAAYRRAIF